MTERQAVVARYVARGFSQRFTNAATGVSRDTIRAWMKQPEFMAEVERIRALTDGSAPMGVLVDCLGARRDDGVDYPTRLRAALALIEIERGSDDIGDAGEIGWH